MQEYPCWLYSAITDRDNKIPADLVEVQPECMLFMDSPSVPLNSRKDDQKRGKGKLEEKLYCNVYVLLLLC